MAADAVMQVGLDLSPAEASLNKFYGKLRQLQQKAGEGGTANTKAIQLPRELAREVAAPAVPAAARSQGTSDRSVAARNKALQESVALQAKRVALLEREFRIAAQIANAPKGEIDTGVASIRAAGRQGLSRSLGLSEADFNRQFKNSFDRQIRSFQDQFKNLTIPQQTSLLRQQAVPVLRDAGITATIGGKNLGNATYDPFKGETEAAARNLAASTTAAAGNAARTATATAQQAATSEAAAAASAEALAKSRAAYAKAEAANAGAIDRAKRAGRVAPAAVVAPSVGEALQEPVFTGDVTKRTDRTTAIRDQARLLALKEEEFLINERIAQNSRKIGRGTPVVSSEIANLERSARAGLQSQIGRLNSTDSRVLNTALAKAREELAGIAKLPLSEQAKNLQAMAVNSEGLFAPALANQGITGRAVAAVPAGQITPSGRTELRPGDVLNPDDKETQTRAVGAAIANFEKVIVESAAQLQLQNAGLVRELAEATAASQLFSTELQLAALRVANGKGAQAATLAEVAVARAEQNAQTKEVIADDPGLRTGLVDAQGRALRSDAAVVATQAAEVSYLESVRANTRARLGLDTAVRTSATAEDIAAKAANQLAKQEEKAAVALAADTERNLRGRQARSEARKLRDASGQVVRQAPQRVPGGQRIDPTQRTDFDRLAQNRANAEKDLARVRRQAEQSRIFSEAEARNANLLVSGAVPKYNVDAPINLPDEKAIIKQQQTLLGQEIGAIKRQVANEEAAGTLTGQAKALLQQEIALREAMITELSRSLTAAGRVAAGTAGMAPYKASIAPYIEDPDPQGKAVKEANRKADEAQVRSAAARQVAAERQQQRLTAALNTPVVAGDDTARRQALASAGYSAGEQKRLRDRALREKERADVAAQQRTLRRAAAQEKDALLSGSTTLAPYKASEINTLQFTTEKAMLKEIQRQLRDEIASGKLSAAEVKAREELLVKLRGKLAALGNVERGTTPKSGNAALFFEDDLAAQRAAQARKAASQDPAYRQAGLDAARRQAVQDQVDREARARIAGTASPVPYSASTNFNTERMILKKQLAILNEMSQSETQLAQQNAIDAQITQAKGQMKRLQQAENAAMGFGPSGPRPPSGPTAPGGAQGGGGWFSRFTSKFRSGHQYDTPGSFFGRGALSSIQYGLPSMLLYGAASGIAGSIREAEELQYVFSKLEGQIQSTFGADSEAIVDDFKKTIIDTAVQSGLAADELGTTALKIFGTFSQRDIGGFEGPDLANKQVESLGKLQRVTGLTAKQLENDYSAISIAFNRTFEDIGDQVTAVSDITGVDAGELGTFAGDISAVLVEAGFTLEESLALGAASAQNSGKSMSTISEAYGRVIPQLASQTAKLNELATMSPALQTPAFLDAVRLQDGANILQEIGKQYDNLDERAQNFLVAEIFGRREAQSVLPGLTNQEGYAKTLTAAQGAEGDLDKRYQRVMQNLSSQLAKLGEQIRILFKELLEGGLGQFLQLLLTTAEAIVKTFGGLFSIIGGINDLTDGWLGNIVLIAATLKGVSASMQAIAGLQFVQNMLSASRGGGGPGLFASTIGRTNTFQYARSGYQAARYGSYVPATLSPPMAAQGLGTAATGGVGAGLRGGLSGAVTGIGGGSFALGAGAIGLTAVAAAGYYVKSRIDAANKAVEDIKTEEESIYQEALAKSDTPGTRRELSDATLRKAQDAADRQTAMNRVLETLFNVTTEEEALKKEAVQVLLDTKTEETLDTLVTTSAGGDFIRSFFGLDDDKPSDKDAERIEEEITNYANERGLIIAMRARLVEQLEDAKGAEREAIQEDIADVDAVLRGEATTGDLGGLNETGDRIQIDIGDASKATQSIIGALDEAGIEIGTLDPKVRQALIDAVNASNPGAVLQDLLNKDDNGLESGAQQQLQDIIGIITTAAESDPTVAAAIAAKDPVAAMTRALENLDNDYKNGLISAATYARGKAAAAAELRRQMDIGNALPDQETLNQLQDAEREARDSLSNQINLRLEADLKFIERFSTGNEELDFGPKLAALESAIQSGFLNEDDLDSALDQWFETEKEKLQQAIDDAASATEAQRIADAGFEIPDYIRVNSIKSYLQSLDVAWGDLNTVMQEFFGTSADAYIATLISSVSAGETTIEAARENIGAVLAAAQAALQAAINLNVLGDFLPIFGTNAGTDEEAKAKQEELQKKIDALQAIYDALGIADPGATQAGYVDPEKSKNDESKAADARASYMKALANRNQLEIAQIDKAEAARKYQEAQALSGDERAAAEWEALEMDVKANQDIIAAVKNIYDAKVGYLRAVLEFNGDQIGSLEAEAIRIQNDIKDAYAAGDEAGVYAGLEAQVRNQEQIRQERGRLRDSAYGLFETVVAKDDPVAQLRVQEALAREQLRDAVGVAAKNDAQRNLIDIQRQLNDAMNEARYSRYSLRQAELEAMDEDAAAAGVAAELARQQLNDAIGRGAGEAEINNLKAAVISADRAAADALTQEKLDDYKFLYDMGQITKSQYINYLEALKNTLQPGTDQFKELELQLRQLKNDISGDLQANLPTSLTLPTLYEVRRLNQIGGSAPSPGDAGTSASIGYQDNRTQDIQITIGQNMSQDEIVDILDRAIGTGRSGYGPRRY